MPSSIPSSSKLALQSPLPPVSAGGKRRPLSVGSLRAFEAVARQLNFRKAAEDLFLSQPAVSRQIQGLEEDLGASLFIRHTRSVELTEAGAQLYRSVRSALERIDLTVGQIRQQQHRRSVAITTFASFASMWAIPQLEQFQKAQPEIDFRLDASDRYVDLDRSDQDIALRLGYIDQTPKEAIVLFREKLVPMANPLLIPAGGLSAIEQLRDYTLIENDVDFNPLLSWTQWLELHGAAQLTPKRWMRFNYVYQMLQVALAGQGIVLARLALMADSVRRGDLVEVFPGRNDLHFEPPLCYWMVVNVHSAQRPEVRALVAWLRDAAKQTHEPL